MSSMKRFIYVLISIGFLNLAGCGNSLDTPLSERYSGSWQEDFNLAITKTFVAKGISDCGQYKFRESSKDRGEYLVYCTSDGNNWTAYLVWPNISEVTGPYTLDPSLQ